MSWDLGWLELFERVTSHYTRVEGDGFNQPAYKIAMILTSKHRQPITGPSSALFPSSEILKLSHHSLASAASNSDVAVRLHV